MHKVWEYLIIIVVQVEAVKIHVAAVEALRKKERADETQFTTKVGGKTSLGPQVFRSQLRVWCTIMLKLALLAPQSPDFTYHFSR
jgi:hypothetical protein